ncbi:hypothetical protein ACFLWR_05130 [Chloroflexota bacterium]
MADKKTSKKAYRIVQIEGKMSYKIEELWDGGAERSPYGSKEAAIKAEEKFAQENGFMDDLVLQDVIEDKVSLTDAFERDNRGNWHCKKGCSIEIGNKEIVFTEGMTFSKGVSHLSVDVAQWLDDNS